MEETNSEQFAAKMKLHENRLRYIEGATQIEHELQNSIALPLVIEVAQKEADEALALLATVDPTDTKKIIALQAKVYCSRMLSEIIVAIRQRGAFASKAIHEEAELGELPDGQEI